MSTESEGFPPDPGAELDLGLPEPLPCPFCDRIAAGDYDEEPRRGCYVFAPLNPVTPGHLLIIPGEHVRDAAAAPATAAAVMHQAALLAQRLGGDANLITSIGAAATQTVPHLHVHLVPRREGDGLHLPWTGQREGLLTVSREDLRAVLRNGTFGPDLIAAADRLAFAARYTADEAQVTR